MRKEGEKVWTKLSAKALRIDTKADLLSSAPPPVMAEALQLNEETVTSGRQLIARPAGSPCDSIIVVLFDHHNSLRNHRDTGTLENWRTRKLYALRQWPRTASLSESLEVKVAPDLSPADHVNNDREGSFIVSIVASMFSSKATRRRPPSGMSARETRFWRARAPLSAPGWRPSAPLQKVSADPYFNRTHCEKSGVRNPIVRRRAGGTTVRQ